MRQFKSNDLAVSMGISMDIITHGKREINTIKTKQIKMYAH